MNHLIRAEAARGELDELGAKHFLDVRATVRRVLDGMPGPRRAAFAAAVADRVLARHRSPRAVEMSAFATSARSILDGIWQGLSGDTSSDDLVATAVGRFYLSPFWRVHRHDDPTDLDDHLAMAVFYAGACYLHGCLEFATWSGWRGFDTAAICAAADVVWPHRRPTEISPYAWELAHPAVQAELERQLEDVELLCHDGDTLAPTALTRLRHAATPD